MPSFPSPRCTILAIGSRGDVQPLVALGAGLRERGFEVCCATHADFETFVREHGLGFRPLTGSSASFYSGPAGAALRERMRNGRRLARFYDHYLSAFVKKLLLGCWEVSQDADVILCSPWMRVGPSLAERLGIPVIIASVTPVLHLPTAAFPNPFQGPAHLRLGPIFNRLSWRLALPFTRVGQKQVDLWRQETLGLSPIAWREELRALRRLPHIFGYSPAVLPKPRDWSEWVHVTGYWFLNQASSFAPPLDLEAFLAAGPAPVAIGFSSQVGRETAKVTKVVVEALNRAKGRGILISGFGGLKDVELPEHIFRVRTVPYDWLLPRVAAMVHQGGAGSTSAALRAGVPSMAVPFGFEQGLWGRRIASLGAGPAPIPAEKLTAQNLCDAIRRMLVDESFRRHAQRIGEAIRSEDGIGQAAAMITGILAQGRRPSVVLPTFT
jgi:sterol 3beta-glucosyltransferase